MKKLLTFFLTALLAFSVGWAAEVTITMANQGWANAQVVNQVSSGPVTISLTKGGNNEPKYYTSDATLRVYNGGTVTVSASTKIQKIVFEGTLYLSYNGNDGSYSNGTWTANTSSTATQVQFSNTGTTKFKSITVTYESGGTPAADNWYKKVTSSIDLVAGKKYIIVYENGASSVGMGQLNTNRHGVPVNGLSIADSKVNIGGTEVMEMTLGGSTNAWTFNMGNAYLAAGDTDKFLASSSVGSTTSDITKWTITPSSSACTIKNNSGTKYIRYASSSSSPVFMCYNVNYQSPVALYVQYEGEVDDIEFSPAAGTYTGTQNVTISCGTSNATIYYTTDGSTPTTSSTVYSGPIQVAEDMTIRALAVAPAMDSSESSAVYTINSGGGQSISTIYRKVTSTDQLVPGQKYIIMYENGSSSVGMGAISSSAGQAISNMAISNNQVDINGKDVLIMTLGGSNNAWTFATNSAGNGNYLAYSGSSTNINSNGTATDTKAQWTVSSTTNGFILVNNSATTRSIQYNGNTFKAYAQEESPAVLYVQEDSDAPMMQVPESLSIEDATGDATGSITVSAQNLTDGISVSTSGNYWSATPNSLGVDGGDVTVEYTGRKLVSIGSVNLHTATADVDDENVAVNYLYTGDIYIVTKIPGSNWNFNSGDHIIQMTRQSDGTYKAELTVPDYGGHNGPGDSETEYNHEFLQFTQRVGDGITWGSKYFFGPEAGSNWWLTEGSMNNPAYFEEANSHVIQMLPGQWTITVDPSNNSVTFSPTIANPVITLASGRYYEAQTTTITCATEIAHIYYTTDGSDPSLTNGTLYDGNPVAINADMTLKAVAVLGTNNPTYSDVVTATYTIRALDGTDFLLANTVTVNDEYVLVYSSNTTDYAMSTFHSDNYYNTTTSSSDFELNDNIVTRKTENVNVLTIEPAGNGQYYIVDQDGYYLYYNSGNLVHRSKSFDANNNAYKWNITIGDDGVASIENVGTESRYLRCNTSGGARYACYTNPSNAKLYKRAITVPRLRVSETEIDLGTIEAGGTSVSKTFTVHGMNLTQDVTLSVADAENFTVQPTTISAADANNGYVTVTVTYTGSATTASTTVTVANSEVTAQTVTVTAARTPLAVTISPASGTFSGSTMGGITIEANAADATIYYSLDNGQSWQEYTTGTSISVTAASIGDRPTVQAYAVYNGETSATVTATYERVAKSSTLFEKVTSSTQIKADNKYIFVYENGSYGLTGNGYTASIQLNGSVADIGTSPTTILTLGGNATSGYTLYYIDGEGTKYLSHSSRNTAYSTTENTLTIQNDSYDGFYVKDKDDNYYFCYNAGNDPFRWYQSVNGTPAYLYVQGGQIEAPEITPASGTYYESQSVSISDESDDVTIWYTTDGSDPATSVTRIKYNGQFDVSYVAGTETTIIAVAIDEEDHVSESATVTYTWGMPSVNIVPDSRNVASENVTVTMSGTPTGAAIYYTTDGNDPTTSSTLYEGAFSVSLPNVGDHVTVKAIAVYNGVSSELATATYTRVEKMIDVHAPFFSPLEGKDGGYSGIYYGDQTLQIATSTENADIYYVIEEVSGTNPSASVADPTKSSTHYTGPIDMTVGNSYRVKAIAYIGDFASTVSEGYYIIKDPNDIDWPSASEASYYVTSCKEFNELSSSNAGTKFIFANPVQVVYHSTYVNNGTSAEYCYVRDNTDYACIYFGKADTHNYHIFEMGDWIAGATIEGPLNVYEHNYHNQLGTSAHTINATLWPSQRIGWSEIVPETTTCTEIASGTPAAGNNKWGHYVHVRYSTMSGVHDETGYQQSGNYDMKHTGSIQDQTSQALDYYDKFYLWSAGTCRYSGTTYTINAKGDYTQDFFDAKQNAGATFDVYGVVDWYGTNGVGTFQVCPIDFLWIYKPVITVNPGNTVGGEADTYAETQIVSISATQPEWAAENVVIYYKTDDMDDWAEYIGPFEVSSNTTVQTYAQVEAIKNDAAHTNYNDIMRSITISKEFKFEGIEDPEIAPASMVIEVISGNEKVEGVVIADNNDENSGAVTVYTTDGSIPSATNGTQIAASDIVELDDITETTTITAISYLEVKDAQGNVTSTLWSNPVTVTYTFVKKNGVIYDLVTEAPQEGNVYVIVNKDAYMGLSTKQNDNNRGSVGVMFVDDATKEQVYGNDELALFVLEKASAGRYYFKNINGDGYLTVAGNAGLRTGDKDFYAEAGIQVGVQDAGYPATITFSYDGTPRVMRYFAKGRTFSTYSDASLNENVFLYGVEATPLAYIEATPSLQGKQVTVSDQLIGTWYVKHTEGNVVHPLLIAKDQNYANVKTFINTDLEQKDYMRDVLGWQTRDWDQSNWVVLDFMDVPNGVEAAEALVGKKIKQATVTGVYLDKDNYTIMLEGNAPIADGDVSGDYPGYMGGLNILAEGEEEESPKLYQYAYNTYMPANFLNANLNLDGNEGFVAQAGAAAPSHVGERLFFVNPKVMEVVRVWGVWAGNDVFTVYEPDQKTVNGWGIEGGFGVNWSYNRLNASGEPINYGYPTGLDDFKDKAYLFHAMIARKTRNTLRANGTADSTPSLSEEFVLYPLDIPSDASNYTAVRKVNAVKEVVSVRYYNVMGMESEKPFEGINIVVTRYSDGSASTVKVLR